LNPCEFGPKFEDGIAHTDLSCQPRTGFPRATRNPVRANTYS
jgi:hypothetical protein